MLRGRPADTAALHEMVLDRPLNDRIKSGMTLTVI